MTAQLPKLFRVTENFEGRRCHWYVSQRKHALVGVADTMQEFFTKAEARTFVKLARERLGIPDLRIAPAPATPLTPTACCTVVRGRVTIANGSNGTRSARTARVCRFPAKSTNRRQRPRPEMR